MGISTEVYQNTKVLFKSQHLNERLYGRDNSDVNGDYSKKQGPWEAEGECWSHPRLPDY